MLLAGTERGGRKRQHDDIFDQGNSPRRRGGDPDCFSRRREGRRSLHPVRFRIADTDGSSGTQAGSGGKICRFCPARPALSRLVPRCPTFDFFWEYAGRPIAECGFRIAECRMGKAVAGGACTHSNAEFGVRNFKKRGAESAAGGACIQC